MWCWPKAGGQTKAILDMCYLHSNILSKNELHLGTGGLEEWLYESLLLEGGKTFGHSVK